MTEPTLTLHRSGDLLLTFESHSVRVPLTEEGLFILRKVLIARQMEPHPRLNTPGLPTQALIDAWLTQEGNEEKMLAGKARQREEIRAATGVRIRDVAKATELGTLDLEGL